MRKPNERCWRCKQNIIISEKNVAADKKYILRKMGLKLQNSKSNISCKIAFCIFFVTKCELFGVKRSMKFGLFDSCLLLSHAP